MISFNYEKFKKFIEDYCQDPEGNNYIYIDREKVLLKTEFDINGKRWVEIETILEGMYNL